MMKDLVKSFVEVSLRRKSVRSLNNRPISNEILAQLLTISQLAPSSFNLQPYKFIIAQSNDSQRALASAMLGNNENVVNEASVSIIFLGDREPIHCAQSLLALERKQSVRNVSNYDLYSRVSFLFRKGKVSSRLKDFATHLMSPLKPFPSVYTDTRIWSALNIGIVAQQLMLTSAAYGIDSQPMEGFDERRLQMNLKVPSERYFIPLVISLGYPSQSKTDLPLSDFSSLLTVSSNYEINHRILKDRLRFPLDELCYLNEFGQSWKGELDTATR